VTTLGIIGGGQLGRMLALAAAPLGIECVAVEPAEKAPAAIAADVIRATYGDRGALEHLARRCDVVTVELEHVPVDALGWLAERVPVRPSPNVVAIAQDRLLEKQALRAAGIPTAAWAEALEAFPEGTVVKRRFGGYDGRGQVMVPPGGTVAAVLDGDCISEAVVPFERELSIVAARDLDGAVVTYPVVENRHADGILRATRAPAPRLDSRTQAQADGFARRLMSAWDYVGVIAVELFQLVDGSLLANEVAPRVHNSGHWTIEGTDTSQFEQHVRAVCSLPLGSAEPWGVAAMVNLIGAIPDAAAVLAVPGAHLHLYGKEPWPGRKVGHVTVVAAEETELDERLQCLKLC
jgi:5-(carboxyamino)imidazole ribonucleotide synthase